MNEEKQVAVYEQETKKSLLEVSSLIIDSPQTYASADALRAKIKSDGKLLKEEKEKIVKPINDSLKRIRDLFRPVETTHEQALGIIETKMIAFRRSEDERIAKEKARVASKVETGYIKPATAVQKMENLGDTKTNLKTAGVKTSVRKLPRVRIVSEKDIPREYLVVNEKLVLEALKLGKQVAGAELYYEEIIA